MASRVTLETSIQREWTEQDSLEPGNMRYISLILFRSTGCMLGATDSIIWVWDVGGVGFMARGGIPYTQFDLVWWVCMLCYSLLPLPRPATSQIILSVLGACGLRDSNGLKIKRSGVRFSLLVMCRSIGHIIGPTSLSILPLVDENCVWVGQAACILACRVHCILPSSTGLSLLCPCWKNVSALSTLRPIIGFHLPFMSALFHNNVMLY